MFKLKLSVLMVGLGWLIFANAVTSQSNVKTQQNTTQIDNNSATQHPQVTRVVLTPQLKKYREQLQEFSKMQRDNQEIQLEIKHQQLLDQLKKAEQDSIENTTSNNKSNNTTKKNPLENEVGVISVMGKGNSLQAEIYNNNNGTLQTVSVGNMLFDGWQVTKINSKNVIITNKKNKKSVKLPFGV